MPNYVPEPVPQGDTDPSEMTRYLQQELFRISAAVNVKTDGAAGGMVQEGVPVPIVFPVVPVPFTPYTIANPDLDNLYGVIPNLVDGSLTVVTGGGYVFIFNTSLSVIPNNTTLLFRLYVNDVATDFGYLVDAGNTVAAVGAALSGMAQIQRGDKLQMYISAVAERIVNVSSSSFLVFRISEASD